MIRALIDQLYQNNTLPQDELLYLITYIDDTDRTYLYGRADALHQKFYGKKVFTRGLIEFTNFCKQDCMYCGIQRSNREVERYRMMPEEILAACQEGADLGYRTFVLQGGEDPYYTDDIIVSLVKEIKRRFPDCAITLSIGEKSYESYERYYQAGADRYLLRHETASRELYEKLHPTMSFDNRRECLYALKRIGYQVGAGFMVGLPGQKPEDYVKDLLFLKELQPHMVGIGPFIPQKHTPLAGATTGSTETTLLMIALTRLMLPDALLPATTALGSINSKGRELAIQAGANVVMPNLTPTRYRDKYALYDGKICIGDEAVKCRKCIEARITKTGYELDMSVGHHVSHEQIPLP